MRIRIPSITELDERYGKGIENPTDNYLLDPAGIAEFYDIDDDIVLLDDFDSEVIDSDRVEAEVLENFRYRITEIKHLILKLGCIPKPVLLRRINVLMDLTEYPKPSEEDDFEWPLTANGEVYCGKIVVVDDDNGESYHPTKVCEVRGLVPYTSVFNLIGGKYASIFPTEGSGEAYVLLPGQELYYLALCEAINECPSICGKGRSYQIPSVVAYNSKQQYDLMELEQIV